MKELPTPQPVIDCMHQLCVALRRSTRLVDSFIAVALGHPAAAALGPTKQPLAGEVAQVVPLLCQAVGASTNTLVGLSAKPGFHTRDCYSIARAIIETSVNVCYILSEGPEVAARMARHARQKSVRELNRESRIAGSVFKTAFSGSDALHADPQVAADLAEFTFSSGREAQHWIDTGIDARIAAVGRVCGASVLHFLHSSRFMVYRHASEVLHGTLFGALHFFGVSLPQRPANLDERARYIGNQHVMILLAVLFAHVAIVRCFDHIHGAPGLSEEAKQLLGSVASHPYFSGGTVSEPNGGAQAKESDDQQA
jgi:hypothetical protein